jgi:hypothetical protein
VSVVTIRSKRSIRRRPEAVSGSKDRFEKAERAREEALELERLEKKFLAAQQLFEAQKGIVLQAMLSAKMEEAELPSGVVVKVERPKGRGLTVIDPAKYREKVSDDDFLASIKVQVTEAKKCLGERELQSVSTTTGGGIGDPRIAIKHPKIPAKRK